MAQTSPQVQADSLYDMYGKTDTNKKKYKGGGYIHMCILYIYIYTYENHTELGISHIISKELKHLI